VVQAPSLNQGREDLPSFARRRRPVRSGALSGRRRLAARTPRLLGRTGPRSDSEGPSRGGRAGWFVCVVRPRGQWPPTSSQMSRGSAPVLSRKKSYYTHVDQRMTSCECQHWEKADHRLPTVRSVIDPEASAPGSWQRIGGESPPRGRFSQPSRPRVMHEVLLARAAVKRSQGRPRAKY
jgi:hypothetical protein